MVTSCMLVRRMLNRLTMKRCVIVLCAIILLLWTCLSGYLPFHKKDTKLLKLPTFTFPDYLEAQENRNWIVTKTNSSYVIRLNHIISVSDILFVVTKHMETFHNDVNQQVKQVEHLKVFGQHEFISPFHDEIWADKIIARQKTVNLYAVHFPPIRKVEDWQALDMDVPVVYESLLPVANCSLHNASTECRQHLDIHRHHKPAPIWHELSTDSYPFYLYAVNNGYVDSAGIVRGEWLDLIPDQCKQPDIQFDSIYTGAYAQYSTVFVITQCWGNAYFHGNIENMPRLALFLPFLQLHPDIMIHVARRELRDALDALGISSNRMVLGYVQAKLVYVPQGSGCGKVHQVAGPLLRQHYLRKTLYHQTLLPDKLSYMKCRRSIVLIDRGGKGSKRWLQQLPAIRAMLMSQAETIGYTVTVFGNRVDFKSTVVIFSEAAMVVGVHGAGFSNLLYARSGTHVVEILCACYVNRCFQAVSKALGHIYVGLIGNNAVDCISHDCGPVTIDLPYLKQIVSNIIQTIGAIEGNC